jgi:hypothetical protein
MTFRLPAGPPYNVPRVHRKTVLFPFVVALNSWGQYAASAHEFGATTNYDSEGKFIPQGLTWRSGS